MKIFLANRISEIVFFFVSNIRSLSSKQGLFFPFFFWTCKNLQVIASKSHYSYFFLHLISIIIIAINVAVSFIHQKNEV